MEDQQTLPKVVPTLPETAVDEKGSKTGLIIAAVVVVLILVALIVGVIALFQADLDTTSRVRDIFIIFMALEFLIVGVALIVLMLQLATLINLLRNEIKPILDSTNQTVNTLRGTATFLSDNLAEPVIKLNASLAGIKKALDLLHLGRR